MKPTFLYVKEHTITKLKYFGKTTRKNIESYTGSGKYWKNHINKYGKEYIKTIWISEPFYDISLLKEFSIFFSQEFDIVNSTKWANLREENGFDGAPVGVKHPDSVTSRFKNKETNPSGAGFKNSFYGKKHTDKQKEIWKNMRLGNKNPNYGAKSFTEETYKKLRLPKNNKINYKGSPGKITCIDKAGKAIQINKELYNSQKLLNLPQSEWDYVNTNSKEAKIRKNAKFDI